MSEKTDAAALVALGAAEAVARISHGDISAERYAAALLERCAAGKALNAFITLEPDAVLEAARRCDRERRKGPRPGALFGLPIPLKDCVNTRDFPTTAGTPALRHFRPAADAPIVTALLRAGAIVLGKTNMHELGYGWTSNNQAFGAVRNPYDPTRIPGGSSGGTAAAIAARMAPLGVAEDTNGSIRVPAALCGIMGLRPTTGRYPTHGCVPLSAVFDQVGPHARMVADLALFDSVAAGDWRPLQPQPLREVRLGVVRDYWYRDLDPEVERITSAALGLSRLYRDYFSRTGVAAIVFPTTVVPALPIGAEGEVRIGSRRVSLFTALARNITPASTTGLPGLVLPAGLTSSGLPVSIELDAAAGSDRALLALGMSVAEVLGSLPPPR